MGIKGDILLRFDFSTIMVKETMNKLHEPEIAYGEGLPLFKKHQE